MGCTSVYAVVIISYQSKRIDISISGNGQIPFNTYCFRCNLFKMVKIEGFFFCLFKITK